MNNINRTVYGSFLQTCQLMKLKFTMMPSSTLNEKFNIQNGTTVAAGEIPGVGYYAIGNGGHKYVSIDGISRPEPLQHLATDAALFNHIPFVLRPTSNDLTQAERSKYGLRKLETHSGESYYAYYLRRLSTADITASTEYRIVANGSTTVSTFVPNASNLNPVPSELATSGTNAVTGDYVASSAKLPLTFTADEVSELLNVAKVLYKDEKFAIISEVAIVSGVDKVVQVQSTSGTINFNEVIGAQVYSFYNTHMDMAFLNTGLTMLLDVGSTEPLFKIES